MTPDAKRTRTRLLAAFAAVYVIWGSTYLAIRFAVETIPPFVMGGARFLVSGAILYFWARRRDSEVPTKAHWMTASVVGVLLLVGGNGAVMWSEQRVPSGVAALLVAVVSLWMVLIEWLRPGGRRPHNAVFVGLVLGLAGVALLVGPGALRGNGSVDTIGALVLVGGSLSWAAGSVYNKHSPRPSSAILLTGMQMLAGGVAFLIVAAATGELSSFSIRNVAMPSLIGWSYLVTFGSLIGFTAYIYLLGATTPAKASTYAYVNPVVAVFLGWAIAGEPVSARTLAAAAVILAGVAIITVKGSSASKKEEPSSYVTRASATAGEDETGLAGASAGGGSPKTSLENSARSIARNAASNSASVRLNARGKVDA